MGPGGVDHIDFGDGNAADEYLVGDWNGSGRDDFAVRYGNRIFFRNQSNSHPGAPGPMGPGGIDHIDFGDGNVEDEYLVGNWDGTRQSRIAVRRDDAIILMMEKGTKFVFFSLQLFAF